MTLPKMKVKLLDGEAMPPRRATDGAAGLDVFAHFGPGALETLEFKAGEVRKVPLGFAVELEPGFYADVRGRSGHTLHGDFSVELGTIDSDYRGEVSAMVRAHRDFVMLNGTKVAQMLLHKGVYLHIEMVDSLTETRRGDGGFGSTGR